MNREDERKLKFDRRLRERLGWVKDTELEAELAALPDASDKMATTDRPAEEPAEGPAAGGES